MNWFRNFAYILFVLVVLGYLIIVGKSLFFPFLFAIFFAFLLMPLESRLYRHIPNKAFSIITSYLIFFGIVGGAAFLFGQQIIAIFSDVKSIQSQLQQGIESIFNFVDKNVPYVEVPSDRASRDKMISRLLEAPIQYIAAGVTNGAGLLVNFVLTIIYSIFLLIYKDAFRDFVIIQFSRDKREEVEQVLSQSIHLIQKYLVGMVSVIGILAVLNVAGLLIIGVEHALFWGVLAACLVIIPYIGTTLGGLLPFLYSLATSEHSWQPFAVVGMYFLIQQIEGNFITPKVVGSSVRINPFFALISVVVLGSVLGIGGIVLAIPLLALFKLFAERIDILKPVALLMDKDIMEKRSLFMSRYDREDYRLGALLNEEDSKK